MLFKQLRLLQLKQGDMNELRSQPQPKSVAKEQAQVELEFMIEHQEYAAKQLKMLNHVSNYPYSLKTCEYEDMCAIPEEEADLIPVPTYINMSTRYRVDESVQADEIGKKGEPSALRCIFRGQSQRAEDLIFQMARDNKWDKGFQFDLLLCFWYSIHMGNRHILNKVMIFDVYLRQLVTLALMDRDEMPAAFRKRNNRMAIKDEQLEGGSEEDDIAVEFRSGK